MYNITRTNGINLTQLDENIIDFDVVSNIGLIGKLSPNYGETQSNNFVHLAENFASHLPPEKPLLGMIYFNTQDKTLYMCTDESQQIWTKLVSMKFEPPKDPQTGDMYYDVETKQLFVYDSTIEPYGDWVLIGPDNFKNKKRYSTVLETRNGLSEADFEIPIDANTSNLVTIKIVASEKISDKSNNYGRKEPETSAWIYKTLVNSYITMDGDSVKIVGSPTYELIGRTDGTSDWKIALTIKDNRLLVTAFGTVADLSSAIKWEIDVELLKV